MSPKRPKAPAELPACAALVDAFTKAFVLTEETPFEFADYFYKEGVFPATLVQHRHLMRLCLELAPSGVISWDRLKSSFLDFYRENPRADPYISAKGWTCNRSAEASASAVKAMA